MIKLKTLLQSATLALAVCWTVMAPRSDAATGRWNLDPSSGDWNVPHHWSSATVPNAPEDVAIFGLSNTTSLFVSATTLLDGIVFDPGASAYEITVRSRMFFRISGTGITNNSGAGQHLVTAGGATNQRGGIIEFANGATVGNSTHLTNSGAAFANGDGGLTIFRDASRAGNGTITNAGGTVSGASGGSTLFYDAAFAGNGTIVADGGRVTGAGGGNVFFGGSSSVGSATLLAHGGVAAGAGGGTLEFGDGTDTGNSTLVASSGINGGEGGSIRLSGRMNLGTARVMVFGNGALDISNGYNDSQPAVIGSLEGDGNVFLGERTLAIGVNNLSTVFTGVIQYGDPGSSTNGGALTKTGSGTLTLTAAQTYRGTTTVAGGALIITGSLAGAVRVNTGTLGGSGTVRSVIVSSGGQLSPGDTPDGSGILNVAGNLTLTQTLADSLPIFAVDLNGILAGTQYDQLNVTGGVNLGDATLTLRLGFVPTLGDQFTILNNDGADSIFGTFSGLSEGAVFASGGQVFAISYQGSDGNDVVLTTVIPEPATWAFLATAGALALGGMLRRWKERALTSRAMKHAAVIAAVCLSTTADRADAASALWSSTPGSDLWNVPSNWTPATVPNGRGDAAAFGSSSTTAVSVSENTLLGGLSFNPGASGFTITARATVMLTLAGSGIANTSGLTQHLVAGVRESGGAGVIELSESATITGDVVITASGALSPSTGNPAAVGGTLSFRDQSGAGEGTFRSEGGTVPGASGGHIIFRDSSTADRGTFTAAGGGVLNGNGSSIEFYGTASAGHARFMNLGGAHDASKGGSGGIPAISMASGGEMIFHDDSSAGEANIVNAGGAARIARGAYLFFRDSATAGHSSVKNIGGEAVGSLGGFTVFEGAATAGRSTIVATGSTADFAYGASIAFGGNTSADDALLVAMGGEAGRSGGEIYLGHNSDGWTARVAVFGNGSLDISAHQEPGVAIGSLEGSGIVYLGSRDLTIGTNNLTRDFSGSVLDRRPFSSEMLGGGIIKIGAGTLTLSGQSSYSGPTTVNAGRLLVTGSLTSAVFVNGGTFGGSGFIAALTVSGSARLSPGEEPGTTGILTVTGRTALRRSPSSSSPLYVVDLNGLAPGTQHDQLSARGGVNLESATLSVTVRFQPLHGATFTIINNDSPEPLVGTFDGLPEGARFTSGGQTFAISYLGGSGNDVVLTALPPSPRMPRNAAR